MWVKRFSYSILFSLLMFVLNINTNLFSQVWDYPPKPLFSSEDQVNWKMDNVKTLEIWTKKMVNPDSLGDFRFSERMVYDSLGRLNVLIENEDTVTYTHFENGFWSVGVSNGDTITQKISLDTNGNVIYRKHDDVIDSIVYDQKNRPIAKYSTYQSSFWNYKDGNLVSFVQKSDGEIFEKTAYYYDTIKSTIAYMRCEYHQLTNERVLSCDSTFAIVDKNDNPTYFINIDYSWGKPDTISCHAKYNDNGYLTEVTYGCLQLEYLYDENDYLILARIYNCDGIIVGEERFDYVFFE